jgi:hypothetical protein
MALVFVDSIREEIRKDLAFFLIGLSLGGYYGFSYSEKIRDDAYKEHVQRNMLVYPEEVKNLERLVK